MLETCDYKGVGSALIGECAEEDLMGTCEELLAFEQY